MIAVEDAIAIILESTAPLPAEDVSLADALGLVLAVDVHAGAAQPPFPAAVVDGFALRAADGDLPRRLIGEQTAGYVGDLEVQPGTAVRITTGAPIPAGADLVVKVEQSDELDGWVTPHPGQLLRSGLGIRPVGSDVATGERVLAAGQVLGPAELGMLASLGMPDAPVHRRPVVGVFSTGDELVDPGNALALGQIYDSNRPTLLAAVSQAGGTPLDLGIVRDRPGELERAVARGLAEADMVVTSGGVSMGELDLLKPLLERWGQVLFGRVLMKPGKPLTVAMLPARNASGAIALDRSPRTVFALPGNPVSSLVTFQLFVRPAIRRLSGYRQTGLPQVIARLDHEFRLDPERPEYHRVTLRREHDEFVVVSTGSQASSRLLSATGANGLLVLEQASGSLPTGTERPVLLLDELWLAD